MEKEFLHVINENQGIILKVCRIYCSDRNDSEDLFQEVVLQLWRAYPAFKGDAKVSTWMYRISLNTAITRLRKINRKPATQPLGEEHQSLSDPLVQRLDIEFDHALQAAIKMLDKIDKALVMLYLDEKSYKEMSEIIGISESNIGVKINRIKKKLKENIQR